MLHPTLGGVWTLGHLRGVQVRATCDSRAGGGRLPHPICYSTLSIFRNLEQEVLPN